MPNSGPSGYGKKFVIWKPNCAAFSISKTTFTYITIAEHQDGKNTSLNFVCQYYSIPTLDFAETLEMPTNKSRNSAFSLASRTGSVVVLSTDLLSIAFNFCLSCTYSNGISDEENCIVVLATRIYHHKVK